MNPLPLPTWIDSLLNCPVTAAPLALVERRLCL